MDHVTELVVPFRALLQWHMVNRTVG